MCCSLQHLQWSQNLTQSLPNLYIFPPKMAEYLSEALQDQIDFDI